MLLGPGKLVMPCERMHCENLSCVLVLLLDRRARRERCDRGTRVGSGRRLVAEAGDDVCRPAAAGRDHDVETDKSHCDYAGAPSPVGTSLKHRGHGPERTGTLVTRP